MPAEPTTALDTELDAECDKLSAIVCFMLNNGAFYGHHYYGTPIGNPVLEVEPTGHPGRTATGSDRNGSAAVFGVYSTHPRVAC